MGKVKSEKRTAVRLGVKNGVNMKSQLLKLYHEKKEMQKAVKMIAVEKTKQTKMLSYPTSYLKIDESCVDAINRHLILTPAMALSTMMTSEEVHEISETIRSRLGGFNGSSVIDNAMRLFSSVNAVYDHSDEAVAHLVGAMDDDVMKVLLQTVSQFLNDVDDRVLRVFIDEMNPTTKERYVSFQFNLNPESQQDVGKDMYSLINLTNVTSQVKHQSTRVISERVRYRITRRKYIRNEHNVDSISRLELKSRAETQTPITGHSFVKKTTDTPQYQLEEIEGIERIVFEIIVKLPEVDSTRRICLQEELKNCHNIHRLTHRINN